MTATLSNINWGNSPSWANYAAVDSDGQFNWFSKKPVAQQFGQYWDSMDALCCNDSRFDCLPPTNWVDS